MAKHRVNLPRDSPLSLLSMVEFSSPLETNMILRITNETFLRITRYLSMKTLGISCLALSADWTVRSVKETTFKKKNPKPSASNSVSCSSLPDERATDLVALSQKVTPVPLK